MKTAVATVLLWGAIVSTGAALGEVPCPATPSKLALRFGTTPPKTDPVTLVDSTGRKYGFYKGLGPVFPQATWIHDRSGPTKLGEFADLRLDSDTCSQAQLTGPKLTRLEDGVCYGVFEVSVTPTCWTLEVLSDPYGYPFEVEVDTGPLPIRSEDDDKHWNGPWNVQRNLPRGKPANVRILAVGSHKPLLSIKVSYARLSRDRRWTLTTRELILSVVLSDETGFKRETKAEQWARILAIKADKWERNRELRALGVTLLAVE